MKKLLLVIALAGCAQSMPPVPAAEQDTCNAAAYEYLVGQDATALEKVLLVGKVRVIRPDQAVTMDFQADRINFRVNEDEKIASIICG